MESSASWKSRVPYCERASTERPLKTVGDCQGQLAFDVQTYVLRLQCHSFCWLNARERHYEPTVLTISKRHGVWRRVVAALLEADRPHRLCENLPQTWEVRALSRNIVAPKVRALFSYGIASTQDKACYSSAGPTVASKLR
jgi:hypothetical protein